MKKSLLLFALGTLFGLGLSVVVGPSETPARVVRVISVPGDRVEVRKGEIYRNGAKLSNRNGIVVVY